MRVSPPITWTVSAQLGQSGPTATMLSPGETMSCEHSISALIPDAVTVIRSVPIPRACRSDA